MSSVDIPRLRIEKIAGLAVVFCAALWAAWSMLDRYFLGDDFAYIARFGELPWSAWPQLFLSDWSGGIWQTQLRELRPFAALSFMIDARLWGANPLGWHLTNLALDTLNAWLVVAIGWRLRPDQLWLGVVAGCLFAVHPTHAETVAWITGRVDVVATAMYLTGFWAAITWLETGRRRWLALTCGAYFVGVFSKEFVLTLPLLIAAYAGVFRERVRVPWVKSITRLGGGLILIFLGYAICRHIAFSGQLGSENPANPLRMDYLKRQLHYVMWIMPIGPQPGRFPSILSWPLLTLFLGILFASALTTMIDWRESGRRIGRLLLFFGFIWYTTGTLPLAFTSYFSPRHLYFATAGFALAFVWILDGFIREPKLKFALLVVSFAWFTYVFSGAVRPWRASAKVSERIARAIAVEQETDALWVLDLPANWQGVWLWSWASPAALNPPFQVRPSSLLLENPDVYVAPHHWINQAQTVGANGVAKTVLFSLTSRGEVERRVVAGPDFEKAKSSLLNDLQTRSPSEAWMRFVTAIKSP